MDHFRNQKRFSRLGLNWRIKIPSKIAVFVWRLFRDRLPTRKNLQRRQVQITDMSCPFCRSVEEETSHLFIHCIKIQPIWWETMSWMNIKCAFPLNPKHHFPSTHLCSGWRHKGQEVAVLVVGCNMVYLAAQKQNLVLRGNIRWKQTVWRCDFLNVDLAL